jgi:hypothetical protein
MRHGRRLASSAGLQGSSPWASTEPGTGWRAMLRSQPAATCQAVGGVDPGGQLTASGGALRVDAMMGIGQQMLPGSIRPPGATGQGTESYRLKH